MNEGEFRNMEFQSGSMDPGSFFGMLFVAMYKADGINRARLKLGFHNEVESAERWMREEGYAKKLKAAYQDGKGDITFKRVE